MFLEAEKKAVILAYIASLIFGLSITLNKYFLVKTDFFAFIGLRFLFLSLFSLGILFSKKQLDFRKFDKIQWKYILGSSLLWIVFSGLFFYGLRSTTPSHASFFYVGFPISAILLGVLFFKRGIDPRKFLFISAWALGIILVYFSKVEPTDLWNSDIGDLFILASIVILGFGNILDKKSMIRDEDKSMVSFCKYLAGFLLMIVFLAVFGRAHLSGIRFVDILYIFSSSVLMIGSVYLWNFSSSLIEGASGVFPAILLSPIVTFVSSLLLFKEPMPIIQLVGYLFVLVSLWMIFKGGYSERLGLFYA